MGRRKRLFKVPFLKLKINKKSSFNIVGFIIIASSLVSILSFLSPFSTDEVNGRLLSKIKIFLTETNGIFGIILPFVLLLISSIFFSSKRLKLIKPNVLIGLVLTYISVLGISRAGKWGAFVFGSLQQDFSNAGAIAILTVTFFIGLILLLNTSVDAFAMFIANIGKGFVFFVKNHLLYEFLESRKNNKKLKKNEQTDKFINDNPQQKPSVSGTKQSFAIHQPATVSSADIIMKPTYSSSSRWVYPPFSIMQDISQQEADRGDVNWNATTIEKTLESFGIRAKVDEMNKGPTVTQYALKITMGTRLSRITALGNDLALALAAPTGQVRIEAPIPGRSLVGIEIPNIRPEVVTIKRLLESSAMKQNSDPLLVPLGLDVSGNPQVTTIEEMPHVLIAGTTGSGKSVLLNAWISTFLFRTKPEELRLIMVDPKRVELTQYNGIPHLLGKEVIVDPDKIINALRWTVGEMETRYKDFAKVRAKNIQNYNNHPGVEKKPYILFIIDELAALMMFAPGDAEDLITRIAQMARATGIHLILATQRPSVDVITGLMKANIPARIAFNVSSQVDSRVIIDTPGAEKLLGRGDMLFLPPDQAKPKRIQGPFITSKEVKELVNFLRSQTPEITYPEEITKRSESLLVGMSSRRSEDGSNKDPLFDQALDLIFQHNTASASFLQRKFSIGYTRAARLLDQIEEAGYIGPASGQKPREILKRRDATREEV